MLSYHILRKNQEFFLVKIEIAAPSLREWLAMTLEVILRQAQDERGKGGLNYLNPAPFILHHLPN
jgi:hypothetical protein